METIAYILGGVAAVYVTVEIRLFVLRHVYGHSDAESLMSALWERERRPHWLTPEEWEEEKWRKKGMKYWLKHGKHKKRKIRELTKKWKKWKWKIEKK